jgi:hypothetical protein
MGGGAASVMDDSSSRSGLGCYPSGRSHFFKGAARLPASNVCLHCSNSERFLLVQPVLRLHELLELKAV